MLAALRRAYLAETRGEWEVKLEVKNFDPEVEILDVSHHTLREYSPHFFSANYVAVKARFRYQAEYHVRDSTGKLKYGGNLTRGPSSEIKDLTFARQISQIRFDEKNVTDTFHDSLWRLISVM